MDYNTILVPCDSSSAVASRIALARHIAERSNGHQIGLHIRAYGIPRMKELALGGATRTILGRMTVPVLLAH